MALNGYAYVGGNPVNRVDPSGMCWLNTTSSAVQQGQCLEAWVNYASRENLDDATIRTLIRQENDYWGNLPYDEFARLWNDNQLRPPLSTNSLSGTSESMIGGGGILILGDGPLPIGDVPGWVFIVAGLCVAGLAAVGVGAVVLSQRQYYNFSAQVYEYHLTGFDKKVTSLAQHLAKLLNHDVAGFQPSPDPNPNRDPDRGWCVTIRRIIQEIDGAGYSGNQLNRDLEAAGMGGNNWNSIIAAVKEVVEEGLCNDHWGDFGGGSLATS